MFISFFGQTGGSGGTPGSAPAGTFVLSDYPGADTTGATSSQDALELALADLKAYKAAYGLPATLDLGGSSNTWRLNPIHRSEKGSKGQSFSYGVCMLFVSLTDVTITGTASDNRPTILMDAQPETEGGDPRDPADYITGRGEFLHFDDCQDCTVQNIIVDGQAPITVAANNWGIPGYGWDFSHKGCVIQFGSDNVQLLDVDMSNFRSEFVYANGDLPYVGTILIDGGTWTGTTASMFSCTASLTVQNLTVRECPQGIENYAYADMDTVVDNCDVDTSFVAYQSYDSVYLNMQNGVVYTIEDNSGGADFTNVGAPNNNVGTSFTASSNDEPTSWGTGTLSRSVRGNGIVIFNQRGTGTVTIDDTTVANSTSAILITDFAHNWTVTNFTATDVDSVFGLSNQNTSSSSADWHIHAGWRDFTVNNLTVNATNRSVVSIVQSDGANQNAVYVNGAETISPDLDGWYDIASHDTNGRHGYAARFPDAGESPVIEWDGVSKWQIKDGATVYYEAEQDVWLPSEVTSWTPVSGANSIAVTQHIPRDWAFDGITINESGGNNVQSVVTSKAGIYNGTIANANVSMLNNPLSVTTGEGVAYYPPLFDPLTCTFANQTIYLNGSDLRPLWGGTAVLTPNPDTEVTISTDYDNYLTDGLQWTFRSNTSANRTVNFEGSGGPDSVVVTNSVTATLEYDKPTKTWAEV